MFSITTDSAGTSSSSQKVYVQKEFHLGRRSSGSRRRYQKKNRRKNLKHPASPSTRSTAPTMASLGLAKDNSFRFGKTHTVHGSDSKRIQSCPSVISLKFHEHLSAKHANMNEIKNIVNLSCTKCKFKIEFLQILYLTHKREAESRHFLYLLRR